VLPLEIISLKKFRTLEKTQTIIGSLSAGEVAQCLRLHNLADVCMLRVPTSCKTIYIGVDIFRKFLKALLAGHFAALKAIDKFEPIEFCRSDSG
jgi:hypothetical protein